MNTAQPTSRGISRLASQITLAELGGAVAAGAEVHLVPGLLEGLREGTVPCLHNTRYLLLEPSHHVAPPRFAESVFQLVELCARHHPSRAADLDRRPLSGFQGPHAPRRLDLGNGRSLDRPVRSACEVLGRALPGRGWAYTRADLSTRTKGGPALSIDARKDYPSAWEMLRTDIYAQGQGIRHPDGQSFTGHYWYQTQLDMNADHTASKPHLMFPGLFNECWLYVNGDLVAHRPASEPWWASDYRFEWDVDLTGKLKPGKNLITLRGNNPHHFGGMFRRPFLYQPKAG